MLTNLPPELAKLDQISRERWATVAGVAITMQTPPETLAAMVSAGEAEFIRHARRCFHGQDFQTDDFRRMFEIVRRKVQSLGTMPQPEPNRWVN